MQKLIKSHKKRKELNFRIIISALILTLLTISPADASVSKLEFSSFTGIGHAPAQIDAKNLEDVWGLGLTLTLYENSEPFKKIGQYLGFRCKNNFTAFLGYNYCFLCHHLPVYDI